MLTTARPYRDAAVAYFVYGVIYLAGAVYLGQTGTSPRTAGAGSVGWYLIGAVMAVGFPILIWKEYKWITRALALLVFVRLLGLSRMFVTPEWSMMPLPWGGRISEAYGAAAFFLVALVTCCYLARAGWGAWIVARWTRGEAAERV